MWLFRLLSLQMTPLPKFSKKMLWLMASTASINKHFHRVFEKWDVLKSRCWWRYAVWIMCQCLLDSRLESNRKDPNELYLSSNFLFPIILCNAWFPQWPISFFMDCAWQGVARFYKSRKKHIITTQTEHKCVLDSCRSLETEGFHITYLPVKRNGLIDLKVSCY